MLIQMIFWICLWPIIVSLRVSSAETAEWLVDVPKSVEGLLGSCVVIPCSFKYPAHGKTYSSLKGIWLKGNDETVFHPVSSKISNEFKGRTSLVGDLHQNKCSLKISQLRSGDIGPFMFRIEIKDLNSYGFVNQKVSINVRETPPQPTISIEEELTSGKEATATCAVSHTCPSTLPEITWSHKGSTSSSSQFHPQAEWITSYRLTFTPSREDHMKNLSCDAKFPTKTVTVYRKLNVKYPPYNVKMEFGASVMENSTLKLNCTSDSNPPATHSWFSSGGKKLGEGSTYQLVKVTRQTEAIACTASNTEGNKSSDPQKMTPLYHPDIKIESACQVLNTTICVCIVDSNPPSEVQWLSPDSKQTFPSSKTERAGSLTISTLMGWHDFPEAIMCLANNALGQSSVSLKVPTNDMFLYIAVTSGGLVLVSILLCAVKRHCRRRRSTPQTVSGSRDEQNEMKKTANQSALEKTEEDIYTNCPSDPVYANWKEEGEGGRRTGRRNSESIFYHDENPQPFGNTSEDEEIYANM